MNQIRIRTRKPRTRRLRHVGVLVGLVLAAQAVGLAPAGAAGCADAHHQIETFRITVQPAEKTYRIGERARIITLVEREVGGTYTPAQDVRVLLAASVRRREVIGAGTTNEDGRTVVSLKLNRQLRPGIADVFGHAFKSSLDLPCVPQETGFVDAEDVFRVRGR